MQVQGALSGKAAIPPDQYLELRYEDLLAEPEKTMREILAFCRLGDCPTFWEKFHATRFNLASLEKWKADLDTTAQDAMVRVAGELMAQLGYNEISQKPH